LELERLYTLEDWLDVGGNRQKDFRAYCWLDFGRLCTFEDWFG
jgi:hypothetical protein